MRNLFSRLQRNLTRLWSRAVIQRLNNTTAYQQVAISMIASETQDAMEYLEPYGFTSTAHAGSEGVAPFLAGDRSHGIVINVADRRYRLKGLKEGEVAIYTDEGDSIVLKRGQLIEATTDTFLLNAKSKIEMTTGRFIVQAKNKIELGTPQVETSGKFMAVQSIVSQADIQDKQGSMNTMRSQYNGHRHKGDSGGMTGTTNQGIK